MLARSPNSRVIPSEPVSIVMPICNECEAVEAVVKEWAEEVMEHLPPGSELLFDDGASTDGTVEILENLSRYHPYIRILKNNVRDGFANAARRLYTHAKCDLIFFTDSDGQYVPAEFWKLTPFLERFPLVHGAKIGRQDPFFRKVASALFNRIARFIFDFHYSDINSAFRFVRREAILEMLPRLKCMPTLLNAELLIRMELENYPIKQVRVLHRARIAGVSRGLPVRTFLSESLRAYHGLLKLKEEYRL